MSSSPFYFLNEDPRNKELAIDPEGDGGYRPDEARTALRAEEEGSLKPPVRRALGSVRPEEKGADFVDGDNKTFDVKDASQGAEDIADGASGPDPENILVDTSELSPAERTQLQQDVDSKLSNEPNPGEVKLSPPPPDPPEGGDP